MSALRLLFACVLMVPVLAQAQATRTWVSGVGDDVNPCSRTAPCQTFAGAVGKTAAGGEIDSLDPGVFGGVTLTKSMTLDGGGGKNSILNAVSGGDALVINAGATGVVTLRNLRIEGAGGGRHGVRVLGASVVQLENCVISGFSGEGILVEAAGARLFLSNVVVRQNGGAGVLLNAAEASALAERSSFTANSEGFRVAGGGRATLYDSVLSGNTGAGLVADASEVNLERATLSRNGTGVLATGAGGVARLSKANIVDSGGAPLQETAGGKVRSFRNNRIPGLTTSLASARASTSTQLSAELQADQSLRLSVRVESPSGAPSGPVVFSQGETQVGVVELADQAAAFVLAALAPGTHTFTARYLGDELFDPSVSEQAELALPSSPDGGLQSDGGTEEPGPDGGLLSDGGTEAPGPDGGLLSDGGTEAPGPDAPAGGCGCSSNSGGSGLFLALAAIALAMRRSAIRG